METEYSIKTRLASAATYERVRSFIQEVVEAFMADYRDMYRLVNITITPDPGAIESGWIATAVFDNEPELERERRRNYREADLRGLFSRAARPASSSHGLAGNMGWVPPRPQPHIAPMSHVRPGTVPGYRTDDPRRTTFHDEHDPTIHPGAIPPGSTANKPAPIVKEPAPEDQVSWFRRAARWMGMELDR